MAGILKTPAAAIAVGRTASKMLCSEKKSIWAQMICRRVERESRRLCESNSV